MPELLDQLALQNSIVTLDAVECQTAPYVETIRHVNDTSKVNKEVCYLLSSCPDSPAILGQAIRSHWAVRTTCTGSRTSRSRANLSI